VAPNNGLVLFGSGMLVSELDVLGAGAVDPPSVEGGVAPYSGLSCGFGSSPIVYCSWLT
jgi:hypothetical protein